tara:strand:+ start:4547 stop:16651 length:12105 start_codon:yes stop_codon:yes gene_type:complete
MAVDRVKFQDIIASQVPEFVKDDFPLLVDFLKEYYVSQEYQGGTYDLIRNLDQYVKVDELFNLKDSTILLGDITFLDTTIVTSADQNFTDGFPESNGLIQIDNEIISYESKTKTTFEGCTRGFSGITDYIGTNTPDQLTFERTESADHVSGSTIYNLNIRFLQEFFKRIKNQFIPGFSERTLHSGLDQRNFIFSSDSFYKSKGTDQSFEILFRALYGADVEVIRPSKFLIKPSDADYKLTQDYVVEGYLGDPLELKNQTFYQNRTGARGTVTNVEKINYTEGDFYQIAIDYGYRRDSNVEGTIYGKFEPNPKTKILNSVSVGSTVIDVDSTVSFPASGALSVVNVDGDEDILAYSEKTLTQFLGVTTATTAINSKTDICLNNYSYSDTPKGQVQVRVVTSLTNFKINSDTYFFKKDDTVNVKSIGLESKQNKSKSWNYNIKTNWKVSTFTLVDSSEKIFTIKTFDSIFLKSGYRLSLRSNTGLERSLTISAVLSETEFTAILSENISESQFSLTWTLENQILKGSSTKYPALNNINANVLNTYEKFNGDFIVASNSVPNYNSIPTNPYNREFNFSGSAIGDNLVVTPISDHGLYTGDPVYYSPKVNIVTTTTSNGISFTSETVDAFDNVTEGVYYVKRVSSTTIKLARSTSDIFNNRYISPIGTVTDNKFCYYDFYQKNISPQKIYREINNPSTKVGEYRTSPGYNGILINGVELINYKSPDTIFYGGIKGIVINNTGQGYDVINPPIMKVNDIIGIGATGIVAVEGSLEEVRVIDNGFDYTDDPIVIISGGQGIDASAKVNLASIDHSVQFNSGPGTKSGLSLSNNTIGFSTYHKFRENERIVYLTEGVTGVAGLTTGADYYANIVDSLTVTLHDNFNDANVGINTVVITGYGVGIQEFKSYERKKIVSNIIVDNAGSGYKNKKRLIVGVNTAIDQITITNHGYNEKEIVRYTAGATAIDGIDSTTEYYVVKIDDNTFSLSEVGTGQTQSDYFYDNNIFTNIKSEGNGTFNYNPIAVTIQGTIGVNTLTNQDFSCKVQPVFRGSIDSIDIIDEGIGYGASEVLNFNRQPVVTFNSGFGAQLTPIVSNGRIVEVLVNQGGKEYNSPPDLSISGIGSFARLTPITLNGVITEVKVISGGAGYSSDTDIIVKPSGIDATVFTDINQWTINLFARNLPNILGDDGIVDTSISGKTLEYSHLYPSRYLRESTYAIDANGNTIYTESDLKKENDIEVTSVKHSPILGWAYDGHPIYGPYGFSSASGGSIKRMISGYEIALNSTNRPPISQYTDGFFVEDFVFKATGDLDKNNGRYCVTPDYPEGTYAYFTTIRETSDTSGSFKNYRRPVFPYVIGNTFNSDPNKFNFSSSSNHVDFNIEKDGWFRNTTPYHMNNSLSGYDYIFNSNTYKKQKIDIISASAGGIQGVGIFTGGKDYRVNDQLVFDNSFTGGNNAAGRVERVLGKKVSSVSAASTEVYDIEFIPYESRGQFVGYSSDPHKLSDGDLVNISGLSRYYDGLDGNYQIGISTGSFVLLTGVGDTSVTGMTTYFDVGGAIQYPYVRPDDIMEVGGEKVRVLTLDRRNQRIQVLREQSGTIGTSHNVLTKIFKDPRKFTINSGIARTTQTLRLNSVLYFNPAEALGLGTALGTGNETTVTFSNPGAGASVVSIPPQSIYYPNHGLLMNEIVEYSTNGGDSINTWNGAVGASSTVPLSGLGTFYAVRISNRFVGLSTNRVGFSTITGRYIGVNDTNGLLYFTNVGTGVYHNLRTRRNDVVTGQIQKNVVTVSTASTHGLFVGDEVNIDLKPSNEVVVTVKYDEFNRRIVFNPKSFVSGDISTFDDSILFNNNPFKTGDKVIYTSSTPSGGLVNEGIYYVVVHTPVRIKLVEERSEINQVEPRFVNIKTSSAGTLSKINPLINVSKNSTLKFDLSDSSLSFVSNSNRYSAFDLNIYSDSFYRSLYLTSGKDNKFEVTKSGQPGVDATANLTLFVSDYVPSVLWYSFSNTNTTFSPLVNREMIIDSEVSSYNQINLVPTDYDGLQKVSGIGTISFTYNINKVPDILSYDRTNALPLYDTDSLTAYGAISDVEISNSGSGYRSLPGITTVRSGFGTDAILYPESKNIGQILNYKYSSNNIGFDYPHDNTLRVVANLPEILEIESLNSIERIGITSNGINYLLAPDLVVIDGYTNKINEDIKITYTLGDNQVSIIKNSTGLYETLPRIVPTNNTNGIGINSIVYTNSNKNVRVFFNTIFSDEEDFPFVVGEDIFVEGINVGVGTTGTGYNSSQYNYAYFPVIGIQTNLGGTGSFIDYDMSEVISGTQEPGNVTTPIRGRIVPVSQFPIFDVVLKKNDYFLDEQVTNGERNGTVESWNKNTEILKVSTPFEFNLGENIRGLTSNTQGIVRTKYDFKAEIETGAGTTIVNGWNRNTGFLNDNLQRIPNNEYYQNFSYSLKSNVDFNSWNNAVGALNHTAGFKRFADFEIESAAAPVGQASVPVNAIDSNIETVVDIIGKGDLNCFYDYDNVTETSFVVNGKEFSNEIIFDNRILSDYFQSVGNRVLSIDDVSTKFNSNERAEPYESIASFESNYTYNKIVTLARDQVFTDERQFSIVSIIQNDNIGYINQYATLETYPYLGYFDYIATAGGWDLTFFPVKFEVNSYDVSSVAFSILDDKTTTGTRSYGDVSSVFSQRSIIPPSSTGTLVSVGTTYRALKVLSMVEEVPTDTFYSTELNIIHDGTDVSLLEYGSINESENTYSSGIGTFGARISGGNIIVEFHSNTTKTLHCNSAVMAISDNGTSTGSFDLDVTRVGSSYSSISASASPTTNVISSYITPYEATYCIVVVENTTDSEYEMFEFAAINSSSNEFCVEYANTSTGSGIGTVGISKITDGLDIVYTPVANKAVEVRAYFNQLQITTENANPTDIDLNNVIINTNNDTYSGTKLSLKKSFELNHKGNPIFRRIFDGSSSTVVDLQNDFIQIPNHFFVSGESVTYGAPGVGHTSGIGIVTAVIPGIGSTDLLPEEVFLVKLDESKLRFAATAEDALSVPPSTLILNSVGIGASHTITAKNANAKALLAVDNMIQAPVASTKITTILNQNILFDLVLDTVGVSSFASGDIIKIDDEFMIVQSVGTFGVASNLLVTRPELGTKLTNHLAGATITKYSGNYNIVGNSIIFSSPPYGNIPLSSTTNPPDERDWTGITSSSSFQGRTFMKRAGSGTTLETYHLNNVFDDFSSSFTGVSSIFTLQSSGSDLSGISYDTVILTNNIYQSPQGIQATQGDYQIIEDSGITSIRYNGSGTPEGYDPNKSKFPAGGLIISVGSTEGNGYQPLVSAAGTATISGVGTISSVSIGNSGSGYRSGSQIVNVGVQTFNGVIPSIENIGTATIQGGHIVSINITNPGSGYTSSNTPVVVFDSPLSYIDIPLEYSASSPAGIGQSATVDIVVGQGSSIINFELRNSGYAFGPGQILTVPVGGLNGIPVNSSLPFEEFQITIEDIYSDQFNGWSVGEFEVFDALDSQFDGTQKSFKLTINGQPISIRSQAGSNIEVDKTLLVFINDILQQPGVAYQFEGGSVITFAEAPKSGLTDVENSSDTSKIIFYKGSGSVDVIFTDVLETIKIGDLLDIDNNPDLGQPITLNQNSRTVTGINTLDSTETNNYPGPGVTSDQSILRPVTWCKQSVDKFINGKYIGKDRIEYEPQIYPASYLIQSFGVSTTIAYVDNVRPFFNSNNEAANKAFQNAIQIVSQDAKVGASATAIVSAGGSITALNISNAGAGYTSSTANVSISSGIGTNALASAIVTNGHVTSFNISEAGTGYTSTNLPVVLIEPPVLSKEEMTVSSYSGDYGSVVGFGITTVGNSQKFILDFFIDKDSFMRDPNYVGSGITVSGIGTGDFFTIFNSNLSVVPFVGNDVISQYNDQSILGITTQFIDCTYQVESAQILQVDVLGVGMTAIRRIITNVGGISTVTFGTTNITFDSIDYTFDSRIISVYQGGISSNFSFGEFSWGKINVSNRSGNNLFNSYNNRGISGLSTGSLVTRSASLKYNNYT